MKHLFTASLLFVFIFTACTEKNNETQIAEAFQVDYEEFELENGLRVILHQDKSDPVVAVALTAHVGSAREKEGRTGFAHLFEHLLFLESENLGKGGLDQLSARVGGSGANGSTNRDRTNYYQTVPSDALEKMIWGEADKLGYFINTVTQPVLAKEKQVVKNEKRQSYDNRPYGHQSYVIHKNLYPEDHPYHWQVIGTLEDLQRATLEDVKEFYNRWYVPNNVTLSIAGDFDKDQAIEWVKKYFGEIPRGPEVEDLEKRIPQLEETKKLYYEDNFARLPQLTMTWPVIYEYHPDSYALDVLTTYFSEGKEAPLNQVLTEDLQIAVNPSMNYRGSELAGEVTITVRGNAGVDLDSVHSGIYEAFELFEKNGISQADLQRIKARQEARFYGGLSSVLGKGFQLAQYEIFAGGADYINEDIKKIQAVTAEDVKRVYHQYIKGNNYIATSFVPKGTAELALSDSEAALVIEEAILEGAEEDFDPSLAASYERTPSSFDRSIEPPYGETLKFNVPEVWQSKLDNGLEVRGIVNKEVPLVYFTFTINGGQLVEPETASGAANLTAALMTRGTAEKTPVELETALDLLGASVTVSAGQESLTIRGSSLARNFDKTIGLVQEILLEPRWDSLEFRLAKTEVLTRLEQQKADPGSQADIAFAKAIYGKNHVLARNLLGTTASVSDLKIEDLKTYYRNLTPNLTQIQVVGALEKDKAMNALKPLSSAWKEADVVMPNPLVPGAPEQAVVYFIDVPGAKQSQLRFGYAALSATDADFFPATMMNYRLGGGGFASQLTQELRETKGYTYGIRSRFEGSNLPGPFEISSGVRTNVTAESSALIRDILEHYPKDFTAADLVLTKGYFLKSGARAFETPGAKLSYLTDLGMLGLEPDYILKQRETINTITLEQIQEIAKTYVNPERMFYVIVGDAKTQLAKVKALNLGEVKLVDQNLDPVK